jgi:hypothetical protein
LSLSNADVNGDGKPDIVTADEFFDEVSVLVRQSSFKVRRRDHRPECLKENRIVISTNRPDLKLDRHARKAVKS